MVLSTHADGALVLRQKEPPEKLQRDSIGLWRGILDRICDFQRGNLNEQIVRGLSTGIQQALLSLSTLWLFLVTIHGLLTPLLRPCCCSTLGHGCLLSLILTSSMPSVVLEDGEKEETADGGDGGARSRNA